MNATQTILASRFPMVATLAVYLLLAAVPAPARLAPAPGQYTETQQMLDRAYVLLREGKLEAALAAFQQVADREPTNRTARLEMGYLNGQLERWADAARHFAVVLVNEPENLRLRMEYAYALLKAGETGKAAEEFSFVAARPGELQAQARAELEVIHGQQQAVRAARRDAFLNRGYARLREGNRIAARHEFEQALREDPGNAAILRQMGYLALEEGHAALAVQYFESARQADPQDATLALQLGYLYDRLGQPQRAEEAFEAAAGGNDARTQQSARAALGTLRANRLNRLYLDFYASPLYSTRFDNAIAQFQAQLHWRPRASWPVTLYAGTRITHDSQSRGGILPAIFSDNVALVGAGVSFQPRRIHLTFIAEANLAFNLTRSATRNRDVEPDYRVALYYFRRWEGRLYGPVGGLTLGRLRHDRLFTDLDASLGYYSRYQHNVIGYLQLREGARLAQWGGSRLYGYGKISLAKDTNRDFFNNVAEFGAGLEFRPKATLNLSLRAEYLRGVYYGIEGRDANPFGSQYNDVRVILLFGHRIRIK